ncbi:Succinyl-CoA:(R)-benzylsuccinate CoA-transferase subunit BbsE [Geodia barretti]|uniref:Succinyl-CoA:(R)-benzylsuccinate CoA-transferase subunit BbsE n=1 Tax=Geodia barretti TaxID=519541 RepID=A0AA35RU61_GEOBA|nr:Succinyl-CoA:(R)-benzylsuccinate CoA-transferase subunit BbsE [Geodia barretti]
MAAALEGVSVLDLTHCIAGPYCTKLLAGFGADVLKIEPPEGEKGRRMAPFFGDEPGPDSSLPFAYLNSGKRGITLNLKIDVLVENFSPRVLPSLGLDYETISEVAPHLVMVSISNFGQTGPYRDYKAADIVEYALGGLMYIFGAYDREPLKHAFNQAQFKAGTDAASATLMAVYHQRTTGGRGSGQGQHVDVSIQEAVASGLRDVVNNYTYTGAIRRRQPNHSGDLQRLRATADGFLLPNPGLGGGLNWDSFTEFLDLPELDDDRFRTPSARLVNAEELGRILDEYFIHQNKYERFYGSHQRRFIFGVIQSPEEVLEDPQFGHREFFANADHPVLGKVKFPGAPFKMEETPWQLGNSAPTLGQDNGKILGERLGLSLEQLGALRSQGII